MRQLRFTLSTRLTLSLVLLLLFTSPLTVRSAPFLTDELPHSDALIAPPSIQGATRGLSQFLAGHVVIGVILPESDGSLEASQEDWTPEQIAALKQQISRALDWWTARLPLARLRFSVDVQVVPTSYEPIKHGLNDEHLWIGDTLDRLGYSGNYFERAYQAAEDLRTTYQSDWATLLFVANSERHTTGRFNDRRFAYAYINGPMVVMTSDAGPYGAAQFGPVLAHELGHTFGALDQYADAQVPCDQVSGYLNAPTSNSEASNCPLNLPSLMREISGAFPAGALDPSARAQIGYRDSDGDGIIDPLETSPGLRIDTLPGTISGARPFVRGTVTDSSLVTTGRPVSLNHITAIEFRVGQGSWQAIPPFDGAFDSAEETFAYELPLYDGVHELTFRAINTVGASSVVLTRTVKVEGLGNAPDYAVELTAVDTDGTVTLSISAPATTAALQISNDPLFQGTSWQLPAPQLRYTLPVGTGGDALYIRFRDDDGHTSLAYQQLLPESVRLANQPFRHYLPLVLNGI